MKRIPTILLLGTLPLVLAWPLSAQGPVSLAALVTIDTEDIPAFEEAAVEHAQWHERNGDSWFWPVFQALTGPTEYAFVTPNHAWADFDNPAVDMLADQRHWAESGARFATSEELTIWEDLPEVSGPPIEEPMPLVHVFTFETQDDEPVLHGIAKFKEAVEMAGGEANFGWARTVAVDGPTLYRIAVWYPSFAAIGAPGPTPMEMMRNAFGVTEAEQILDAMGDSWNLVSQRLWMYRPDLSYIPT